MVILKTLIKRVVAQSIYGLILAVKRFTRTKLLTKVESSRVVFLLMVNWSLLLEVMRILRFGICSKRSMMENLEKMRLMEWVEMVEQVDLTLLLLINLDKGAEARDFVFSFLFQFQRSIKDSLNEFCLFFMNINSNSFSKAFHSNSSRTFFSFLSSLFSFALEYSAL